MRHRMSGPLFAALTVLALVAGGCVRTSVTTTTATATTIIATSTTTEPPAATTTAEQKGAGVVIANRIVLGWWENGAWRDDPGFRPLEGGEEYQVFPIGDAEMAVVGGPPQVYCDIIVDTGQLWVELTPATDAMGVLAPWPVAAGRADPIQAEAVHLAAAHSLLAERGFDHPDPSFAQLLRTDIDRDGVTEVIAVIERNAGLFPSIGDYGIAFLMIEGEPDSGPLVIEEHLVTELSGTGDDWFYTATTFRVLGVADANADGTDEVVLDSFGWEWGATELLEWRGPRQGFAPVLGRGCGV